MTQEEKGKTYALHKASEKLHDYYGSAMLNVVQFDGNDIKCAYIEGYLQAEQDLEVKEVELEKEIANQYESNYEEYLLYEEFADIAKHFFELGLKAQKGE